MMPLMLVPLYWHCYLSFVICHSSFVIRHWSYSRSAKQATSLVIRQVGAGVG
ncbi:hypothetical protein [Coleofasciculus sp. F4-SAH-05]|uniref:hypothetical protein n=1 Tax=Coleofasciculus sp. F4-SAH-05 TaxID=3069525 RepID=UPI0032F23C0C